MEFDLPAEIHRLHAETTWNTGPTGAPSSTSMITGQPNRFPLPSTAFPIASLIEPLYLKMFRIASSPYARPEASTDAVKASTSPLIMSDKLKRNGTFISNGSFFSGSPDGSVTCDVWISGRGSVGISFRKG